VATEGEWCRRVFLDIIGRIPSVEELEAFLADRSPDKKSKLITRLLDDDDYIEEYARNWTTLWTNILIGRNGGTDPRGRTNRVGMQAYLRRSLQRNKPYDRIVHELVSATGNTTPGEPEYNGATNFLVDKLEEKAALATAETAKIFLGLQVQCTQCHNHPFNEWNQNQFWEMNAFFRQARALRRYKPGTRDIRNVELVNEDFAGEGSTQTPEEAEIYYEPRNNRLVVAYPVFVDGTELKNRSGYVEDVNRRDELAKMIVASDWMPKAIVNRYWGHFLGYGFTKPVDDFGTHNEPAPLHSELLDGLASEFSKNGFDLKRLIRWITLSDAYALSSRMKPGNMQDDPLLGEKPAFSHFYLRQMRAEELYESLLVATQAHKTRGSYEQQEAEKRKWLDQFVIAFGTDEGDETTTFNGTIPQTLMMMNGDLIKNATSAAGGSFLHTVANDAKMNNGAKINHLFLAALSRKPERQEIAWANALLAKRRGDTVAALQDVWWVLLNSNEFILNH
jgi:hypothetical protein